MSVQQSRLPIRKLPDPIIPADAAAPSPANPLGRNLQSPKGWRNRESDGVGLGILAALEKGEAPAKIVVAAPSLSLSAPIVIGSRRTTVHREESEVGCTGRCVRVACHKLRTDEDSRCRELGFFCGSPARIDGDESPAFRTADFLSRCYLCSKRLHGKDIYMYRGEKAFCSMECRYRQIVSDEFQEKCCSEASKPADVSSSPYSGGGRLFFTGIAAA